MLARTRTSRGIMTSDANLENNNTTTTTNTISHQGKNNDAKNGIGTTTTTTTTMATITTMPRTMPMSSSNNKINYKADMSTNSSNTSNNSYTAWSRRSFGRIVPSRNWYHAWYDNNIRASSRSRSSSVVVKQMPLLWWLLASAVCLTALLSTVGSTVASAEFVPSKMFNNNNNYHGSIRHQSLAEDDADGHGTTTTIGNNNGMQLSMYQLRKQMIMRAAAAAAAAAADVGKTEQKQRQHHHHHHHLHHQHSHHQRKRLLGDEDGMAIGGIDSKLLGNEQGDQRSAAPILLVQLLDEEGDEKHGGLSLGKTNIINDNNNYNFLPLTNYEMAGNLAPVSASADGENDVIHSSVVVERSVQEPFLPKQKKSVRRCGTLLLKHIQTVCGGCLRSPNPSETDEAIIMGKREGERQTDFRSRIKRQAPGGFSKITDICCTQRACDDDEVKPFCC